MNMINLKHGDLVIINNRRGTVGTVGGYAVQYNENPVEAGLDWPIRDTADAWKHAVTAKWGTMVCLASDTPKINRLAEENNYKVITVPWSTRWMLNYYGILKEADEVIENKSKRIVTLESLTESQQSILRQGKQLAIRIAQLATLRTFPVHVYVDEQAEQGTKQYGEHGYFSPKDEAVGIEVSMLDDVAKVSRTLLHEFVHGTFQHEDMSRELESDCFALINKLEPVAKLSLVSNSLYGYNPLILHRLRGLTTWITESRLHSSLSYLLFFSFSTHTQTKYLNGANNLPIGYIGNSCNCPQATAYFRYFGMGFCYSFLLSSLSSLAMQRNG